MKLSDRKKVILAEIGLLSCGVIWGGGFVIMKASLDYLPITWLLGVRFSAAGLILGVICFKKLKKADKRTLRGGLLAGVLLFCAFLTQTIGLLGTTAGNNAFLTATYVVLVPFFHLLLSKKRPGARAMIAAVVCFLGVGVIALNEGLRVYAGDLWTLSCGIFFALHMIAVERYTQSGVDVMPLTAIQFLSVGALGLLTGAAFEAPPSRAALFSDNVVFSMAYLVLLGTVYALGVQNIGMCYVQSSHVSLLLGTEALFGFLAGVVFLGEPFSLRFVIGALLIAGAIVISELGEGRRAMGRQATRNGETGKEKTGNGETGNGAVNGARLTMGDK
ncbi:MAG: DMT family transporter [Clostridiales bacterium]|jgi:drug/metabolite transporter (DMT)-like permease|nr:DMT family transporter [Clostridiales bacterium]